MIPENFMVVKACWTKCRGNAFNQLDVEVWDQILDIGDIVWEIIWDSQQQLVRNHVEHIIIEN